MSVFLRNLCLPENAEAIDNARYSMIIEVEAHTRMTFLASILHNFGNIQPIFRTFTLNWANFDDFWSVKPLFCGRGTADSSK